MQGFGFAIGAGEGEVDEADRFVGRAAGGDPELFGGPGASRLQDDDDASGVGGNDYLFKTIPSETDIARGLVKFLATKNVRSVAIAAEAGGFPQANAVAFAKAAQDAGMTVTAQEVITPGTTDFAALLDKLKAGSPDELLIMPGSSTTAFFKAYEASGWKVPISGRLDVGSALSAVSPAFRDSGALASLTSIAVFTPLIDKPDVRAFVASYRAHYGLVPTQRSFFVYEATYLVADAIRGWMFTVSVARVGRG